MAQRWPVVRGDRGVALWSESGGGGKEGGDGREEELEAAAAASALSFLCVLHVTQR